jgi:hypothetical protein
MTDPSTAYIRRPDLRAVEMDGELVMMGQEQGEYYSLRDVAASLWEHLAEARTLDELAVLVAAEYSITADECRDDIAVFLEELRSKDLVRTA